MNDKDTHIKAHMDALYEAFGSLKSEDEIKRFLTDLCTPGEIESFAEWWAITHASQKRKRHDIRSIKNHHAGLHSAPWRTSL